MSLKKDIIKVSFSNFIVLLSSLVNGFVLPLILTFQGYADFRTFTLYAGLIGFLHFGFVDGLNVKYGGENVKDIDFEEFNRFHSFFIYFQVLISVLLVIIGLSTKNTIFVFFSIAIVPYNLRSFFLLFYQAVGEFGEYTKSTLIVPFFTILFTAILYFLKIQSFEYYVIITIVSYIFSLIYLEYNYFKLRKERSKEFIKRISSYNFSEFLRDIKLYKSIFHSGFYIMLGTVLFILFFDTGKWVVKIFRTSDEFALYSMAVSLVGFVVIFVGAINKTFYPYLFKNNSEANIIKLKNILFIISTLSLSSFFIIEELLKRFIPKYVDSLPITAILFLSIPGIFILNSIYFNLYKVNKKEKQFLTDAIKFFIIGVVLTLISYKILNSILSVAIASVISMYIWLLFPSQIKLTILSRLKELLFIFLISVGFLIFYFFNLNFLLGFISNFLFVLIVNYFFYFQEIKENYFMK